MAQDYKEFMQCRAASKVATLPDLEKTELVYIYKEGAQLCSRPILVHFQQPCTNNAGILHHFARVSEL